MARAKVKRDAPPPRSNERRWLFPVVLAGVALIIGGVLLYRILGAQEQIAEREAVEAAPPPALRGYPEADSVTSAEQLAADERPAARLLREHSIEWVWAWVDRDEGIARELYLFRRKENADRYWAVARGEKTEGLGREAVFDAEHHEVWLHRGRAIGRVRTLADEPTPSLPEQLRASAAELDAAIVRTWGANP